MTTSTESHTAVTGQDTPAPETGKSLSQKLIGQKLPSVDLTQPVARYLAPPLKKGVDLPRNLASQGAGLVVGVLRHFREQADRVRGIVKEQADPVADFGSSTAEPEQAEREQAERKLEAAKHKLEAAKRARESATRKLEEARRAREQAERDQAEREQAERETAEREQAERETAEREQAEQ